MVPWKVAAARALDLVGFHQGLKRSHLALDFGQFVKRAIQGLDVRRPLSVPSAPMGINSWAGLYI